MLQRASLFIFRWLLALIVKNKSECKVAHVCGWLSVVFFVECVLTKTWCGMQVQGVRVEVNGQVLSQGGDTQADQIEDTSSTTIVRSNQGFLPAAVIIGLIPGVPLQV